MSIAVPLEELNALLSLAADADYYADYRSSPLNKLLNGWSKRVTEADRRKVFSLVSPSVWKKASGPYAVWVFEQKRKFPNEVGCSVEAIWPTDYCGPSDVEPAVFFDRLLAMVENPKTRRNVSEFVDLVVREGDVFKEIGKSTTLIEELSKTLKKMAAIAPNSVEKVLRILPTSLSKKINLDVKTIQVQKEIALTHALHSATAASFVGKILPVLAEMDGSLVVHNYQLCNVVSQKLSGLDLSVTQKMHKVLASKGWTKRQIFQLAPSPSTNTQVFKEFLPYWLEHQRKEVLELGEHVLWSFCSEPTAESSRQHAKFWTEVRAAGATLAECSTAITSPKMDVGSWIEEGISQIVSGRKTFPALCTGKFGVSHLKGVAPDEIVGMLAIFAHLGGQKIDLDHLGVRAMVLPKADHFDVDEFEYMYGGKAGAKAYDMQQKYIALSEKMNLQQAIGVPKGMAAGSCRRKM